MSDRNADLETEWEPLTRSHERALTNFRSGFTELTEGGSPDPFAIVGAFRSGKTQFMYQMFREAWERGIGAVFVSDPGRLLREFESASGDAIDVWLESRIKREVEHYVAGEPEDVSWFPNASTEQKQKWLAERVDVESAEDVDKYAIFIDEVEQHYEDFLNVVDTDDSNPLRVINDEVPDTLKAWSFGMVSAYEFLGEADWNRLNEIRIPPLDVPEVQNLLENKDPSLGSLANIVWWMGRGRTGLVRKLILDMPEDTMDDVAGWIERQSEVPQAPPLIDNDAWRGSLPAEKWGAAKRALAFQDEGLSEYQLTDNQAFTTEQMTNAVTDAIIETSEFEGAQASKAKGMVQRNTERIIDGLCRPEQKLFPYKELMFDSEQINGLLSLIEDQLLSFEPSGPPRAIAADSIDIDAEEFSAAYFEEVQDKEATEAEVRIPKPSVMDAAFQPIALNPDLVAEEDTDVLRDTIDESVDFAVEHRLNGVVHFCATEEAYHKQLRTIRSNRNITEPHVIVVPNEVGEDVPPQYAVLESLDLVLVASHESSLLWDFIVNLWAVLKNGILAQRPAITDDVRRELIAGVDSRDVRNTIETLYGQVMRLAQEHFNEAAEGYIQRYSRENSIEVVWEEGRLQRENPFWSRGEFTELPVTLSYLLVFSDEPDASQRYWNLHSAMEAGLDQGLLPGGSSFPYSEFFDNLFGVNSLAQSDERDHYTSNGQLDLGVNNTRSGLYRLAKDDDETAVLSDLNDLEKEARKHDIPLLDVDVARHAYAFLRGLLMSKYAIDPESVLDLPSRLSRLQDDFNDLGQDIETAIERIEAADEVLQSPDCADVGTWVELDPGTYGQYSKNVETIVKGIDNLIEQIQVNRGIAPLAYAYWMQLRQYHEKISARFDEKETELSGLNTSTIADLKQIYADLYTTAHDSEILEEYFESHDEMLGQLEAIGDDIFAYAKGRNKIELPEGIETVNEFNSTAADKREQLEALRTKLDKLETEHDRTEEQHESVKQGLSSLLELAEVEQEVES